jgi:hypothetical protein
MKTSLRAIGAVALTLFALPFALVAGLFSRPRTCTPEELASDLRKIAAGTSEMAWDNLESVPIADLHLEAIRKQAMTIKLPVGPDGIAQLERLAAKAEALSAQT